MLSTWTPFHSFWSSPWSARLRGACVWLTQVPGPVVPHTPDALAPGWIKPLCVQREIGKAIAARLAWLRAHPDAAGYLAYEYTIPLWTRAGWTPFAQKALGTWSDERLLLLFQVETERLLRIIQAPPALLGEEVWTRAALGACEHLAQVYHAFRRRYGARAVRRFVRRALVEYIYWEPRREALEVTAETEEATEMAAAPVGE